MGVSHSKQSSAGSEQVDTKHSEPLYQYYIHQLFEQDVVEY